MMMMQPMLIWFEINRNKANELEKRRVMILLRLKIFA